MISTRSASVTLVTLILAAIVTLAQTLPPSPTTGYVPSTEFSTSRAVRHIQVIASQPHPVGSSANKTVREYILEQLLDLGLETTTQRDGHLENVMGRIAGTASSNAVLLTAHLDSTPQSPGAMDDGSGVAVLLETARALMSDSAMRNTVMFLFTDHEEGGLFGAKAFIAHHPWSKDVRVVIGFDAGGISGPGVLSATSADNGWLIRQLVQADPFVVGSSAINTLGYSSTDFGRAFKPAGFAGYAFDLYWDKRDGPEDNIENLSPSSIQHQGHHALSLARHFGNLDPLADTKEPDLVFFGVLRLFTVSYSSMWALVMAVSVMGLFMIVLAYGLRQRILTWTGMVYGMGVMIGGLIVTSLPYALLEYIIGIWVPGVTRDYDHRLIDQPLPMSVIFLTALSLVILWYSQSRKIRKTSLPDLTFGALLLMAAAMAGTSIMLPALSYGFTWPLFTSLLASANWFYGYRRQNRSPMVIAGLLLSGAITIFIVGPAVLLGLFDQLLLALVSLGALCGFLVPQIHLVLGSMPAEMEPIMQPGSSSR